MKKVLGIATLFLLLAFNVKDSINNPTTVTIAPESRLMISGTTNINTFNCNFDTNGLQKPIPVHYEKMGSKYIFKEATLVLNNLGFDCGSNGINRDFHALLKSKEHPELLLKLRTLEGDLKDDKQLMATVDITIAGNTNTYKIPVMKAQEEPGRISGDLTLGLSDFKLKAPKKALGLIVVHDAITISFDLEWELG